MNPTRRQALGTGLALASSAFVPPAFAAEPKQMRVAAINSVYYKLSHAYHIVGRFAYGYTVKGKHHQPPFDVVRMFNHQKPKNDLSGPISKAKNIAVVDSVAASLGGKDSLDVDAVLLICEHGDYPRNKIGQILYPRYELFNEIIEVFKASKKSVPVFVDKHLSYDHEKAAKMVETAKKMGFGLMAGSSLPVTWRKPEWAPELGAKIEEAVVIFYADMDIYGFHALESLQCILERRAGGETGVKSIATLRGESFWKAWDAGKFNPELTEAALRQSTTRDYGSAKDHAADPFAFVVEYLDGTRASLLNLTGYVADISIAVKIAGEKKPQATQFLLPAPPGARFFNPLTWYIEEFFQSGKPPYPVERTLLTSTMLDFAHRSAAEKGQPMADKALAVKYESPKETFFFRGPASDD